jgi:two-component system chemotaxis response regulator CheY
MPTTTMDPPAPSSRPPQGRPARVLYAEDLKDLRELMRLILHRAGYEIETVADGDEALRRLREPRADFDLLITDHHMPVMNGLELVQRLPAIPFQGKVIVFSSEIDPAVHGEYYRRGVHLILPKPIRPETLRRVLAQLLTSAS